LVGAAGTGAEGAFAGAEGANGFGCCVWPSFAFMLMILYTCPESVKINIGVY
jgi:hypothetical protein